MSILGLDLGYNVKYNHLFSEVSLGFAFRNSFRPRVIFDKIIFFFYDIFNKKNNTIMYNFGTKPNIKLYDKTEIFQLRLDVL